MLCCFSGFVFVAIMAPDNPFTEKPKISNLRAVPTIIGEDLTITGNVTSKGEVQIDGEIQGDIHCNSILVGDKAQVRGGVVAEDVVVRGHIVGSIRGLRITLQAQSHVEGDIFHQSLAIEQGAHFEGKSRRSDDPLAEIKGAKAASHSAETSASASSPKTLPPVAAE
jgi:cytoskeletal protein CcmA (bactofilin family)